jgi:hypothetical protein
MTTFDTQDEQAPRTRGVILSTGGFQGGFGRSSQRLVKVRVDAGKRLGRGEPADRLFRVGR